MPLFPRLDADLRASLERDVGRRVRPLAWAVGEHAVVGLADVLCVQRTEGWRQVPWHEIDHGGWNPETSSLTWRTADGPGSVQLADPGRLPELLRERVSASIVLQERVPVPGTREGVTIMARRPLGGADDAGLYWRAIANRGTDLADPAVARVAAEALAARRSEYDIS